MPAVNLQNLLDFWCSDCKRIFSSEVAAAAEGNGGDKAPCPNCGTSVPPAPWYIKNLQKAQANQTGPTTPEGKAKCAGNGYSTGSHYTTHNPGIPHAPCKPFPKGIRVRDISLEGSDYILPDDNKTGDPVEDTGGQYPECASCGDFDLQRSRVFESDGTRVRISCHRREEVALMFQQAFEANDPRMLDKLAASANAQARMLFNRLLEDAFRHGAYVDSLIISEGKIVKDEKGNYLHEKKRNTAIDQLAMLAEKFGWTLPDWVMTPKSKEAKQIATGFLAGEAAKTEDVDAFMKKHDQAMDKLQDVFTRSAEMRKDDPALKALEQEEKHGEEEIG